MSNENPHEHLPIANNHNAQLTRNIELYKHLFKARAYAIMTGHVITKLDPKTPASLSSNVYNYIRKELGFEGLIVSDELNMGAVREYYGKEYTNDSALDAIKANDIILISHPQTFHPLRDIIYKAAKEDTELQEKIEDSFNRVLEYKQLIGLL